MRLDNHRKIHALMMREALSEDEGGALPDEVGGADADEADFELSSIDADDLVIPKALEYVKQLHSDQDGELYSINLAWIDIVITKQLTNCLVGADSYEPYSGREALDAAVRNTLVRILPKIVPAAFRANAKTCATFLSGADVAESYAPFTAYALTNGRQSILLMPGWHSQWWAFVGAGADVRTELLGGQDDVAAFIALMVPRDCELRRETEFYLDVVDRRVRDCEMVEETLRTGTLRVTRLDGNISGGAMVESINGARSALGLEPIDLPANIEVEFRVGVYRVKSITKVHELQKRIHSIEFPDSVRELDNEVFRGLRLRKVFIPRTVTYGVGFLRSIEDWGNMPVIVAFECDEHCLTAERVRAAVDKGAFSRLDVRFGVTRERFRSIGVNESLTNDGAEEDAGLELDVGEPARPYNPYLHDDNDRGDPRNLATNEGDAEELIRAHRDERVWTLTYSDGDYESGELDDYRYGGRRVPRVMTYDDALAAWQAYPLDAELRAAIDDGGYEDEHYELHILLNYAAGLDRCGSEDDREWDWDSLIPVADRYVLYDGDED